jgi:hypothetical protein
MKVTKDIVRDLLPAYLAGEATAETRAVVEEYLAKDVELRQIVEAAGAYSLAPLEAPAGLESRSLKRARRLLGRKNFWMGFALIFCLAAPIVKPLPLADLVMILGLAGWAPFLITCKKLMATGVEAARGWRPRTLWSIVGGLVGVTVILLLEQHAGRGMKWGPLLIAFNSGSLSAAVIGERLHQIQGGVELRGPYLSTLFGKEGPR